MSVNPWSCHYLFLRLKSAAAGIRTFNLPLARSTPLPIAPPPQSYNARHIVEITHTFSFSILHQRIFSNFIVTCRCEPLFLICSTYIYPSPLIFLKIRSSSSLLFLLKHLHFSDSTYCFTHICRFLPIFPRSEKTNSQERKTFRGHIQTMRINCIYLYLKRKVTHWSILKIIEENWRFLGGNCCLSICSILIAIVLRDYDAALLNHCWFLVIQWWNCWYTKMIPSDKKSV